MTDGGRLVPDAVAEQLMRHTVEVSSDLWRKLASDLPAPPPPTRWQRIRGRWLMYRFAAIGWLHDRLFGKDYCNHDGCDW